MTNSVIDPPEWARPRGYANGILAEGGLLFISGQIGWNASKVFESDDFTLQVRQALLNIVAVVEAAGGSPRDVVRLTWYIRDKVSYLENQRQIGAVYREIFGKHFPAMSVIVVQELIEDEALVEIEATANVRDTKTM